MTNKDHLFEQLEGIVDIKPEKKGDVLILRFSGRLDAISTPDAEKKVLEMIDKGSSNLLFDFSNIDYISSAGMRMLLAITKKIKTQPGRLALFGVTTNVMDVFKMSGFDHVLDLHETEEEALEKFKG
ncbi:MAG: STAS domain-containing protein [Parachlamydiaceae bacterium]